MQLRDQNILIFTRTMDLGGTENVVLQLCEVFKPLVKKIVVCSCGGINVEKLQAMEITHYKIPDIENKSPKTIVTVCRSLLNIVKKESITIIHTHHRMAAFYVTLLRLYKNCYFFNTSHNTFFDKRVLTRFAYKNANIIACGEMVKKNLTETFGINSSKVRVVHNAVKPFNDKLIINSTLNHLHKQGFFLVGNIGRLSEQKGMEYFLGAIPVILAEQPMTRFLIVGSGEDEEKLKRLAEDLGVTDAVIFMGYRSDIQNIMRQLDLIVLSSLWEGLPLTPIEAFSVGKTVVATAVDGTVEIVKDEYNGLLVKARNSKQIANKVCELIQNVERRKMYERKAKETFEKEFSFELFGQRYVHAYEEVRQHE